MISIIGTPMCSRCTITKNLLDRKQIPYEYKLFTDLTDAEQNHIMQLAETAHNRSFPIIVKDNTVISLKELN